MAENIRLVVDIIAILAVGVAFIKGGLSFRDELRSQKETIALHSKWIVDHEICNEKQIAILNELREHYAFIRGKLSRDDEGES